MSTTGEVIETKAMVKSNGAPAVQAERPPQPAYFAGFEGAAVAPFSDEVRAILAEPVKAIDVEIRPDGIVYLTAVWYRRQLTRAFGAGGWSIVPRSPARTMGENIIYHGALVALGRFVSEAVGECMTRGGMSYASALEGARSDCLTRCCKDLGMASELWDPAWRREWQRDCAHTYEKNGKTYWAKNDAPDRVIAPLFPQGAPPPAAAQPAPEGPPPPVDDEAAHFAEDSRDTGPVIDTGEPASAEGIKALEAQFKRLKLTKGGVKVLLREFFKVDAHTALSMREADTLLALLLTVPEGAALPWHQHAPAYAAMVRKFETEGRFRS